MLLLLLMVSTLQLHDPPPSCPSAISPLCGPVRTSQHILSAAETGRNPSAETHLQEGKRSQLLTSPPHHVFQTSQQQIVGQRSSKHPITKTPERGPLSGSSWRRSQQNPLGQQSPTVTVPASRRRPSRGVSAGSCCFGFGSGVWSGFWLSGPRQVFLITRQESPPPNRIRSQTLAIVCKI